MEKAKFRRYSIIGQIGFWITLFTMSFMYEIVDYNFRIAFSYAICYTATISTVVYTHYIKLLPLLLKKKYGYYFIFLCLLIVPVIAICIKITEFIYDYTTEHYLLDFASYFFLLVVALIMSSLYYFVEEWFKKIQLENALEKQRLQAELSFLKEQLNPHFLFNTLNNIYSYVQIGHPNTTIMLEKLSSILRFMIYDCSNNQIELDKEIVAIEDLLSIAKMKSSTEKDIQFTATGIKKYHLIEPLFLINFVENAVKHSDAIQNSQGFIHISIEVNEDDILYFKLRNSIKKKRKLIATPYSGLGLSNLEKRLQLQYGDQHQLNINPTEKIYNLALTIPLSRKQ